MVTRTQPTLTQLRADARALHVYGVAKMDRDALIAAIEQASYVRPLHDVERAVLVWLARCGGVMNKDELLSQVRGSSRILVEEDPIRGYPEHEGRATDELFRRGLVVGDSEILGSQSHRVQLTAAGLEEAQVPEGTMEAAVWEAAWHHNGRRDLFAAAVQRHLPGQPKSAQEALADYVKERETYRRRLADVTPGLAAMLDFWRPAPDEMYRWRILMSCGCIEEGALSETLKPGDAYCRVDEHDEPLTKRRIVLWHYRHETELPADDNHPEPRTLVFWNAELVCGHTEDIVVDADWRPADGPTRVDADHQRALEERFRRRRRGWPEDERKDDLRRAKEGWPTPDTMATCYQCAHRRHVVAYEPLGPLVSKKPPRKAPRPRKAVDPKVKIRQQLRAAESEARRLRKQLAALE